MTFDRLVPEDPLAFIRRCVQEGRIHWTYHINMRLQQRGVSRNEILDSAASFEIIAEYPDDKYLPSYLVYFQHRDRVYHVLFATDVAKDHVRVVTAYRPDPEEWDDELKKRRKRR